MAVKLKSRLNGNAQNGENNNIKILKFEVGGRNKKIEGGQGG